MSETFLLPDVAGGLRLQASKLSGLAKITPKNILLLPSFWTFSADALGEWLPGYVAFVQ